MTHAYHDLLRTYEQNPANETGRTALAGLGEHWHRAAADDDQGRVAMATAELDDFYCDNEVLYATVNNTTGDTEKQLGDLQRFVATYAGELTCGSVVDIGCGNGVRITVPMAGMLPGCEVMGVDHRVPDITDGPGNLRFKAGDFAELPVDDRSVQLATAHWSVLNDLVLRKQQLGAMDELRRVIVPGGLFYFDVPSLEGEYGYADLADAYRATHPDEPYGMLRRRFPGGREKQFYIYPKAELDAILDYSGFSIEQSDDWVTHSHQARRTVVARFNG